MRVRLKVRVPVYDHACGDSNDAVTGGQLAPSAVWDTFGIAFDSPDPRRLLMPEDWKDSPARKAYPVSGSSKKPEAGSPCR